MRGCFRYNFDAFAAAESDLESRGFTVLSPHKMDLELGFDPNKTLEEQNFDIKDCVRRDVDAILKADAVVVLPDSDDSPGVTAERALATWVGLPILWYRGPGNLLGRL